ncbi:carboxymuconolactone decarboxylase family protein [Streptomyces sp. NBC_01754]|uniref:carboxymuconolactone decarboxylase family protein n=1 Tax=Streptomyces sp. NBC_01754 TaxID=2975930 RepID=UPI002DDC2DC8|nr:carboxymuconolactone decarboxylase family protein [Streptomyces sp. NBC_01754]WSC96525.1 carboxymuconolactone decarboxylase family protein [Streptomyces sp. NBC_01754]
MPYITISNDQPGIRGLMIHHPDTAAPLNQLANVLLHGDASLNTGERELIAAYVSHLNNTPYCSGTHGAVAAARIEGGQDTVTAAFADPTTAPVTPRLRALLRIAAEVQKDARPVSEEAVTAARANGAQDAHIHDTVLIAAAFCLFNRYVSCLATNLPADSGYYEESAQRILEKGYGTSHNPSGSTNTTN